MRSISKSFVFVFVTFTSFSSTPAQAQLPQEALDAYVKAYTQMGKNAAVMFAQENTRANTQTNQFMALVDAQCKILNAKSQWITSVATANSTNAKTLITLQEARSATLDNKLKVAQTFYDKRKLYDGYQGLNTHKRPTKEDLIRYSQTSAWQQRPEPFPLCSTSGEISWPRALQHEDFNDSRIKLNSYFAQRRSSSLDSAEGIAHGIQEAIAQMREQLLSKVRQMSSAEYIAAKKLIDSLAYEARFAPRIGGVAGN